MQSPLWPDIPAPWLKGCASSGAGSGAALDLPSQRVGSRKQEVMGLLEPVCSEDHGTASGMLGANTGARWGEL